MRIKPGKWMKRVATGIFFVALLLNVKITLDGPYFLVGHELIAQTTGTGTGSDGGTGSDTGTNTLPEITVVCNSGTYGKCRVLKPIDFCPGPLPIVYWECRMSEKPTDSCTVSDEIDCD